MKKHSQMPGIAKILAVSFILFAAGLKLMSQEAISPLTNNIFGQNVVACGHVGAHDYVATDKNIYCRYCQIPSGYFRVWSAPFGYTIQGFTNISDSEGNYHLVLLKDLAGVSYISINRIIAGGQDEVVNGPVALPGIFFSSNYRKIDGKNDLYALSLLIGCGFSGSLSVSHDRGQTWDFVEVTSNREPVFDFALDRNQNIFALGSQGVYEKRANKSDWVLLNSSPGTTSNTTSGANSTKSLQTSTNLSISAVPSIFIDRRNRIIISGYNNTTLISIDGGLTFLPIDTTTNLNTVKSFADDAYGNLYAVSSDFPGSGLWFNANGTGNWIEIDSSLTLASGSATINGICGDSSMLIAAGNSGTFTSSDRGNTWTGVNSGIFAEDIYSLVTQPNGTLVCNTDAGVYYKGASDANWSAANNPSFFTQGTLLFNDRLGFLYAAPPATSDNSISQLSMSFDNGITWTNDIVGAGDAYGSGFYVDETGTQHFYHSLQNVFSRLDIWSRTSVCAEWTQDTAGFNYFPCSDFAIASMCSDRHGYLYAGVSINWLSSMFRRAIDGSKWMVDTVGLPVQNFASNSVMASNTSLGVVFANGSSLFRRGEMGWLSISTPDDTGTISAISVDANGVIYLAETYSAYPQNNAVYFSSDTGKTWSQAYLNGMNIQSLVSHDSTTYALTKGNWGFVFTSHSNGRVATGILPLPSATKGLQVFPNPSSTGEWNIKADDKLIGAEVDLYSENGQLVYHGKLDDDNMQIHGHGLAHGAYMLRVYNSTVSQSMVLVK